MQHTNVAQKDLDILGAQQDIDILMAEAEAGDAEAQNSLGDHFTYGRFNTQPDFVKAKDWYQKAAEQGLLAAQHNLGRCYQFGRGVEQDFDEALKWYFKAASKDHLPSMRSVCGIFIEVGKRSDGVVKSFFNMAFRPKNMPRPYEQETLNS